MKTNQFIIFVVVVAVVIAGLFIYFNQQDSNNNPQPAITDFESCVAAGNPVMESYPRQCRSAAGELFVEEVAMEEGDVVIQTPTRGSLVASPLGVIGKARGTWFFEANIPVTLKDDNGKVLAQQGFAAIGEWMTEDYVNFSGTLVFEQPETEFGVLIIEKDNPSGLPENDKSYAIPVRFQ